MTCPSCKAAFAPETHPDGRCEGVNRGRRFFMMGALALPVAKKLTLAAPFVAPAPMWIQRGDVNMFIATFDDSAAHWSAITMYFALAKPGV